MICYHGTTKKGLISILKNTGIKPISPWTASDQDGDMYVWPEDKLNNQMDYEEKDQFIIHAFESAEVQAILSKETDLFVLELDIPDHLLGDDLSCDNMADVASSLNISDFNKSMITGVFYHKVNIWSFPFIVKYLTGNPYFNKYAVDPDLLEVAENIDNDYHREPTEFWDFKDVTVDTEVLTNG